MAAVRLTTEELVELSFARRLVATGTARQVRLNARINQSELARAIGVPPSRVNNWESGHRRPGGASGLRYAKFLMTLMAGHDPAE